MKKFIRKWETYSQVPIEWVHNRNKGKKIDSILLWARSYILNFIVTYLSCSTRPLVTDATPQTDDDRVDVVF